MPSLPENRNCGACGCKTCREFRGAVAAGEKNPEICPVYRREAAAGPAAADFGAAVFRGTDIVSAPYDFVLTPLPGEPSARKIILPFRPDLVEQLGIKKGDIVAGRPTGAGCPVQHILSVISADKRTGLITGHVVGPAYARGNPDVIDLAMYHMIGFEGIADHIRRPPQFGVRHPFLPGFCMMHRTHTGIVNMVLEQSCGIHVRIEGVIIL
ncbi:MAG: (Fe-S)-binding protein [Methanocorpusculum sp.]|nr:(Fe-S)-binding protein [Methanocorpusculum sp.]